MFLEVLRNWSPRANCNALCTQPQRHVRSGVIANHFAPLDVMRALSVIWLIVFHTWYIGMGMFEPFGYENEHDAHVANGVLLVQNKWWAGPVLMGQLAVDSFFLLSGFLTAYIALREQQKRAAPLRVWRFVSRRVLRILPGLLAALVIYVALTGDAACKTNGGWWHTLLFFNNFDDTKDVCMLWTWSLCVEVQFYLVIAPLLALLWRSHFAQKALSVAMIVGCVGVRYALVVQHELRWPPVLAEYFGDNDGWVDTLYDTPWARCGPLFMGVLVAVVHVERGAVGSWQRPRGALRIAARWTLGLLSLLTIMVLGLTNVVGQICDAPCSIAAAKWKSVVIDPPRFSHKCPALVPEPWGTLFYASWRCIFAGAIAALLHLYLSARSTGDDAVIAEGEETRSAAGSALLRPVRRCLRVAVASRLWYVTAQLSYAMYLLNPIAVGITLQLLIPGIGGEGQHFADPAWLGAAAALALLTSAIMAVLLYMLVERPMMGVIAMLRAKRDASSGGSSEGFNKKDAGRTPFPGAQRRKLNAEMAQYSPGTRLFTDSPVAVRRSPRLAARSAGRKSE